MPKLQESKRNAIECTDFTAGLNTLDDPVDIDKGASPYMLNMDIGKRGKLISRYGYELVTTIPSVTLRGIQAYYRTYDDNTTIDQSDDTGAAYANTYAPPVAIAETAANLKTFTPTAGKGGILGIFIYVVSKGTGNWKLTLHDASNNTLASYTIPNSSLTNAAFNFFDVAYTWTSGALHFHVTSTVADGTLKCNSAGDLSTCSFKENYSTKGDYLIVHGSDGNSYYITASNTSPVTIGSWGTDYGTAVRGLTFNNLALYSNGGKNNTIVTWNGASLGTISSTRSNIFAVYGKRLFTAGDDTATSKASYTDVDATTGLTTNYINVNVGDGTDITSMVPNNDFLQVYKTDSIHGVNFSFDNSYNLTVPQIQPIVNTQGGVWATDSTQAIYGYTYYMSIKGFETYGPSPERIIADRPLPLSLEIEPTFKTINMQYKSAIFSTFWENKYICTVPISPSRLPNFAFVYNESIKRRFGKDNWTIYNDIPAAGFAKFRNSSKVDELYFISANSDGKIYKFNTTFSDAGTGYMKLWTSKTFRIGERTRFQYLDLEGVKTRNSTIDIAIYTDNVIAEDTITDDNLIQSVVTGSYVGDSGVGMSYVGGGYTGSSSPLYKFKKRIRFPDNVNYGYGMYFVLSNQEDAAGWGLNRYYLVYESDPDDPTYDLTT